MGMGIFPYFTFRKLGTVNINSGDGNVAEKSHSASKTQHEDREFIEMGGSWLDCFLPSFG